MVGAPPPPAPVPATCTVVRGGAIKDDEDSDLRCVGEAEEELDLAGIGPRYALSPGHSRDACGGADHPGGRERPDLPDLRGSNKACVPSVRVPEEMGKYPNPTTRSLR
ncbi:hypothetical protein GUJ93_ZPchr0014g46548 [Zizania palustris]|uniref:Uncharacterized protein n=1 Tax=Zizania palustris TaxID=103762 RepID=A0A8J5W0M2_ZIZPA|nr:hypothetical protein GUJ93_ZPchr0014g46548 [Zizania palustris]